MDEHQINDLVERVAHRTAKSTVAETFMMLGVDIKSPLEVQADFRALRTWREGRADAVAWTVRTFIGGIVTAALGAVGWLVMQGKGFAH